MTNSIDAYFAASYKIFIARFGRPYDNDQVFSWSEYGLSLAYFGGVFFLAHITTEFWFSRRKKKIQNKPKVDTAQNTVVEIEKEDTEVPKVSDVLSSKPPAIEKIDKEKRATKKQRNKKQ